MAKFKIFSDTTSDMIPEIRNKYGVEYFRMDFTINGKEYEGDLDFKEISVEDFYKTVGDLKNKCKTSLIAVKDVINRTTPYLKDGYDILYIGTTSALTSSMNSFNLAIEELKEEFPERKIIGIDSHRAGMALGLMCLDCAKLAEEGKSMEEVIEYINKNVLHYTLCGTLPTLTYLKAAGRVSGAKAFFGNMMKIRPIIVMDKVGHNAVVKTIRGTNKALAELFEFTKSNIDPSRNVIYLGQGMSPEFAAYFRKRFTEELHAEVIEYPISPAIGITCGPGVIHIVFYGKEQDFLEEN